MNVEVGMYARTKTQGIKKIDTIFEECPVNRYGYEIGSEWDGKCYEIIKVNNIIQASNNIIELIEVGDYVNGYLVRNIIPDHNYDLHFTYDGFGRCHCRFDIENIRTIVTKEQFKSMEYEVQQ